MLQRSSKLAVYAALDGITVKLGVGLQFCCSGIENTDFDIRFDVVPDA